MLDAQDVFELWKQQPGAGSVPAVGVTTDLQEETPPATTERAIRLKRRRSFADGSRSSSSSSSSQIGIEEQWTPAHEPHAAEAPPPPCRQPAAAAAAGMAAMGAQQQLAPSPAQLPWEGSYLLDYVQRCLQGLTQLYPTTGYICQTRAADLACCIFRRTYLAQGAQTQARLLREHFLAQAVLATSLWIAVKWEATRATTPDATIMHRITGIPAGFLRQQELEILEGLGWNLMGAAREVGAVPPVEHSGSPICAAALLSGPAGSSTSHPGCPGQQLDADKAFSMLPEGPLHRRMAPPGSREGPAWATQQLSLPPGLQLSSSAARPGNLMQHPPGAGSG